MKTVLRISLFTITALALFSCKKTSDLVATIPPADVVNITSKIYPFTTQPANVSLGTSQAVFQQGDVVTIYIPYGVSNDQVLSANLSVNDAQSGDLINTYTLVPSTDSSASQLKIPDDLHDVPFMFVTFTLDNPYLSKTVSLSSAIMGNKASSVDTLNNAFSVK